MLLDIALAVVLLSACSAIGAPLCLLLPAERFRARFAVAAPLGFGLCSIGGTVLYLWGVRPWISMVAHLSGLSIELLTNALTRFPNDLREFGVAIKVLRLGKAIAPR